MVRTLILLAVAAACLQPAPLHAGERAKALLHGYCDKQSYAPGETVSFHISASVAKYSVTITRFGPKSEKVWSKSGLAGQHYPAPWDASANGCKWPVAFTVPVAADWRSGFYHVALTPDENDGQGVGECFFIVRAAKPGSTSKILLQLCTNTYSAYNAWGGYSLYAYNGRNKVQGKRVSFLRPPNIGRFEQWEKHFIAWAEQSGYVLEYCANSDLEFHPQIVDSYRLLLSVGHDEYWSAPMRDTAEGFIGKGGNMAFFSGDTCGWQVRFEEQGDAMVCYKQNFKDDPFYKEGKLKLTTTLWSHHIAERPENTLTGVGFMFGGYHRSHDQYMDGSGAFTVHRPEHWLFEGTKMKAGGTFGGKDTIVGYECDGCDHVMKDGLPYPTGSDGTPRDFVIVAKAPARWPLDAMNWYERWERGREGCAIIGTYTRGGTVVTVGTTDWSHGLRGKDPVTVRMTRNVLDRLSK